MPTPPESMQTACDDADHAIQAAVTLMGNLVKAGEIELANEARLALSMLNNIANVLNLRGGS